MRDGTRSRNRSITVILGFAGQLALGVQGPPLTVLYAHAGECVRLLWLTFAEAFKSYMDDMEPVNEAWKGPRFTVDATDLSAPGLPSFPAPTGEDFWMPEDWLGSQEPGIPVILRRFKSNVPHWISTKQLKPPTPPAESSTQKRQKVDSMH